MCALYPTLSRMLGLAPNVRRRSVTSSWPWMAAQIRGVQPFCRCTCVCVCMCVCVCVCVCVCTCMCHSKFFNYLRWRARNITRAHSCDHTHYKSVHYFLICLKNQVNDLAGLFFANSPSTGCSRGLRRQIVTNECHIGVSPLQLYKNGNFNLVITLLTLFSLNFAVYLRKLHVAPSKLALALSWERTVALALHALELRRIEKLINLTIAVSVVRCSRTFQAWYVSSTYQKVFWMSDLVSIHARIYKLQCILHNKLIIARLLARHLKVSWPITHCVCAWFHWNAYRNIVMS